MIADEISHIADNEDDDYLLYHQEEKQSTIDHEKVINSYERYSYVEKSSHDSPYYAK